MNGNRGIKRMLLGIELTILGVGLVAAISGSGALIGLLVIVAGLIVSFLGMGDDA